MRSGNSMTTCCVVNANILNTLINLDNSKHCSRAISRLSEGRKIHVLSHSIDYPVPLSPSSCSAHVRLPGTKDFQKNFPQKNTSQYPWLGEEIRDWPCLKDLALSWWISARFFDAAEICELRLHTVTCLASLYVGKQHRTNKEPQNRIKMNLAQVTENKQQQTQVHVSTIYFYIHVYISTF